MYKKLTTLGPEWVRVGRWRYNLYGDSHIQTFPIEVDLGALQAASNKFVVRAIGNWADNKSDQRINRSDHICIYRMKLYGKIATHGE
jgi:hypothetical protein